MILFSKILVAVSFSGYLDGQQLYLVEYVIALIAFIDLVLVVSFPVLLLMSERFPLKEITTIIPHLIGDISFYLLYNGSIFNILHLLAIGVSLYSTFYYCSCQPNEMYYLS